MLEMGGEKLFTDGLEALGRGNMNSARAFFERAIEMNDRPAYCSYLAVCIAKDQFDLAVTLCETARVREPENPVHYLNLGKIYLIAGNKPDAIRTFREGLSWAVNDEILEELKKLGIRRPPMFPSWDRDHPANKYLGMLFKKLGLR